MGSGAFGKTPKAGVAGSIPAGRAKFDKAFSVSLLRDFLFLYVEWQFPAEVEAECSVRAAHSTATS
jgi:hypothetical protein